MSADLFEAFCGRSSVQPTPAPAPKQPAPPQRQDTGMIYSRRIDPKQDVSHEEPLWTASKGGNDVLFEAVDEVDMDPAEDEFGDFEDVEEPSNPQTRTSTATKLRVPPSVPSANQPPSTLLDLLSLEGTATPQQQAESQPHIRSDLLGSDVQTVQTSRSSPAADPAPSQFEDDDGWGNFEDMNSAQTESSGKKNVKPSSHARSLPSKTAQASKTSSKAPPDDDWDEFEDGEPTTSVKPLPKPANPPAPNPPDDADGDVFEDNTLSALTQPSKPPSTAFPTSTTRPTNIPPPSTLLSLLSIIYSTLTSPTSSNLNPITIIHLHHTTARITAARPQRWRRDTILAQSTRISAASSGPKGGMKLSSLNKSESSREEREASETIALWNASAVEWWGILKQHGEEAVKGKKRGLRLTLPLVVRVLSGKEGGMEAAYVCPMCGMKRSERVAVVDDGVEDVFGEFWVEGWGHRSCGEVWYRWKGLLGQR